jgi:branched-chain amino acid transport system ATP-binding protein
MSALDNVIVGALCRMNSVAAARDIAMEQLAVVRVQDKARFPAGCATAETEEVIGLLLGIRKRGVTQMVIEHSMWAIMYVSDRIVVLNSGEKLANEPPEKVVKNQRVVDAYLGEGRV